MTKLLVVHLSDIHFESSQDIVVGRADAITAAAISTADTVSRAIVVVTGDVAFSGKAGQYEVAQSFLAAVKSAVENRIQKHVDVVVVPGNHDCDFAGEGSDTRKAVLEAIRTRGNEKMSQEILSTCCKVQIEFQRFQEKTETLSRNQFSPVWSTYTIEIDGKKILLNAVNTAWCSELENGLGAHEFPSEQHQGLMSARADLRILLMHHPYHWFNNARYRQFEKLVRDSSELVFTGHEHTPNAGVISDSIAANATTFFEGGVLQASPASDASSFLTCVVDLDTREIRATRFVWNGRLYAEQLDARKSRELSVAQSVVREFPHTDDWFRTLRDVGAAITHHAKADITLNDLYVFPEFETFSENEEVPKLVLGDHILGSVLGGEVKAIFKGEQSSGKTAWLKVATQYLQDKELIPIFLRGADLNSSSESELRKTLSNAIFLQYGADALEPITQKSRDCKVLIIDGIDRFRFPDRYFNGVIDFFSTRHRSILMTSEQMLSVKAAMEHEAFSKLGDFDKYEIREFGIRARFELTRRWFELAPLLRRGDEAIRRIKIEQTDKAITKLIGRGLVPSFPIYLLVLLQGVEAGQSGELENSALGEYYNYLITHSLLQKIKREDIKSVFDYCDHFAWYLHQAACMAATESELMEFHNGFKRRMDVEVRFEYTKKVLLDTKIWVETEIGVGFRYPYARFFFLGRFLAREMGRDQEVMRLVEEAIKNLHVRENGNIITFLAHFSNDSRVVEMLVKSVESRFEGATPLRLDDDVKPLNSVVGTAAKLVFDIDIAENKRHELVHDDLSTGEALESVELRDSTSPESEILKMLSELNALFKGAEILGSAIKANATSMHGAEKQRLLKVLFDGGLRGVDSLLKGLISNPESFVGEIKDLLDKKKPTNKVETEEVARQAVFMFIAWLLFWFIRRLGGCIGSASLQPAIDRYVSEFPTAANQLISISSALETPTPIPFERLKSLNEDFKSLALAKFLLRNLAYTRVHMYQTEVKERQQLLEEMGISIDAQRAVEYQTRNTKRVIGRPRKKRRGRK